MRLSSLIITGLIAGLLYMTASLGAQPATYSTVRNPINCGILLVPSTSGSSAPGGTNADPYVFYNLLKRQDLLPGGWDFVNPYAPSVVTQRVYDRWRAIMGGAAPYRLGDKIQRSMAPYWEVYLDDLTDQQLAGYHILLIHAPGTLRFSADQRERLRRFVDAGGVLWMDKATSQAVDASSGFPIAFGVTNAGGATQVVDPTNPLLNYPHKISYAEAVSLGLHRGGHAIIPSPGGAADPNGVDFARFIKVAVNSAGGVIMDADFGTGHFVVTSCNVVSRINEPAGGISTGQGRNSGPFAGTNFLNIPTAELKFAYNLMGLIGGHPMHSKGSRKLNATFEDLGAPLLDKWAVPLTTQGSGNQHGRLYRTPIIFKGLLVMTVAGRVLAYDLDPKTDMDNDGNPDDGVPDYSRGAGYDLVWEIALPESQLSTPLGIEVPDPVSTLGSPPPPNQIWVMGESSTIYLVNAFTLSGRRLAPVPQFAVIPSPRQNMIVLPNTTPNALTYADGMIFATAGQQPSGGQPSGICWVLSPRSGRIVATGTDPSSYFVAEGNVTTPVTRPFDTTPTVGYVPQGETGGGSDLMVYAGYRKEDVGRGGPGVAAMWFRSRGEKLQLQAYDSNGNISKLRCRAANQNLGVYMHTGTPDFEELNPRFFVYNRSNGAPANLPNNWRLGATPGEFIYDGDLRGYDVYCDYTIDWSFNVGGPNTPNMARIARTTLELPDASNPANEIAKSLALAPNGNLFVICSDVNVSGGPKSGGGSIYCFKERLNATTLVYRWQLHMGYDHTLGRGSAVPVPPVLADHDDMLTLPDLGNVLDRPLTKMHFHGGPTIHNNVLYVPVSARKPTTFGEIPVTLVLALDADPPPAEIRLGAPIVEGSRSVEISQPDPTVSLSRDTPTGFWRLNNRAGTNNLEVDFETGIIRVNNFMTSVKGAVRNAISLSQPVAVTAGSQGQVLIDPNATGNRWSPLRWFFALNGFSNESPVMVTGNTLFLAGGWVLDSFVCFPPQIPPVPKAVVIGLDVDVPTNDEFLENDPLVPNNTHSNRQLMWAKRQADGTLTWNPHIRWPSSEGIETLKDFCLRVQQSILSRGAQMALGVIGGDGALAVWADDGTHVFERSLTLVADEGRVLELDNSGFVNWTSENTYAGTASDTDVFLKVARLSQPTKAYKMGPSQYLVVDTGADRVVLMDRAGYEMRLIQGFSVDNKLVTDGKLVGFTPGDPPTLRQPRDVSTWSDYVENANNPFTVKSSTGLEYWNHYLIADTGNGRLVEIVDRYTADPTTFAVGGFVDPNVTVGQLVYHSPLNAVGRRYRYHSADRALTGVDQTGLATFAYVSAVGNWETSNTAVGVGPFGGATDDLEAYSGAGAIIVEYFDQSLTLAQRIQVIHKVLSPSSQTGERRIVNPSSAQVITRGWNQSTGRADISILIADQAGVVEIAPTGTGDWTVIWELTNQNYEVLRRAPLRASGARKLTNGNVLITNAFLGRDLDNGLFSGEVIEVRGSDYNPNLANNGFQNARGSVRAAIPPVVGARSLKTPLFADRE